MHTMINELISVIANNTKNVMVQIYVKRNLVVESHLDPQDISMDDDGIYINCGNTDIFVYLEDTVEITYDEEYKTFEIKKEGMEVDITF